MSKQQAIGGYFELELQSIGNFPHCDGVLLNTGRNALEYILRSIGKIRWLYIPYYTCEVIMEVIDKLQIPYLRYVIDENLEIDDNIQLQDGDYLLYTNYFGIKDAYCQRLAQQYDEHLIIDNAQALFAKPIRGIKTIYSPRKFVGVPDGGVAYCDRNIEIPERDISFDRCTHLLKRIDLGANSGYEDFHINEAKLNNQPIRRMSKLTQTLLNSIDFERVKQQRWQNFKQLHAALGDTNLLQIPDMQTFACPMVYPYLCNDANLKKHLIEHNIFVATYWPNIFEWCEPVSLEYQLAERCLPLPIDQRYGEREMNYIIEKIQEYETSSLY